MKQTRQSKSLYFFVPEQFVGETDILITFTALSHGQLLSLDSLITDKRNSEFAYQVCRLTVQNIEDNEGNILPFNSLSPRTLIDLSTNVLEMSSVTQEELDRLQLSVNIKFGGTFQADTWDCDVCKAKRLDKTRNCGYLGNKEKDSTFKLAADGQIYTYCPIYDVDKDLLADGVDSYVMYDKQMLPDVGGLYDQTRFFVLSSSIITHKLREEERKEAKKSRK